MAKKTHSSHCDMMIADLLHELELKVDEAERCQEMIARLNCYDPSTKLPAEIVDYVGNYAPIEIVSTEGFSSISLKSTWPIPAWSRAWQISS